MFCCHSPICLLQCPFMAPVALALCITELKTASVSHSLRHAATNLQGPPPLQSPPQGIPKRKSTFTQRLSLAKLHYYFRISACASHPCSLIYSAFCSASSSFSWLKVENNHKEKSFHLKGNFFSCWRSSV